MLNFYLAVETVDDLRSDVASSLEEVESLAFEMLKEEKKAIKLHIVLMDDDEFLHRPNGEPVELSVALFGESAVSTRWSEVDSSKKSYRMLDQPEPWGPKGVSSEELVEALNKLNKK